MRYIISGGGTGGHIYPALAILDKIKQRDKDAEILYVGTSGSLEEELATRYGYNFKSVRVKGLPRRFNFDTFKSLKILLDGINDSKKLIKEFKPDVAIGTGGYVSFPIVMLSQRRNIPTIIQEQNAFPGKSNRILAKKAKAVAIAFKEASDKLGVDTTFISGNPIRDEFFKLDKYKSREKLGFKSNEKIVLSFGGSGGQESINNAIINILENYNPSYTLVHITGKSWYEEFMEEIENKGIIIPDNVKILDYSYELPLYLSSSDLVVMSSSAISLAEISALGLPSILIPKAYTADNHQVYNARSYENMGASIVYTEDELNGKNLNNSINDLLNNKDRLDEMSFNTKKFAKKDSTDLIVDKIFEISGFYEK